MQPWEKVLTPDGEPYWWNRETDATSWTPPPPPKGKTPPPPPPREHPGPFSGKKAGKVLTCEGLPTPIPPNADAFTRRLAQTGKPLVPVSLMLRWRDDAPAMLRAQQEEARAIIDSAPGLPAAAERD